MKNYALVADYKYCTNCHSCEVVCSNTHDIPLDEWGIQIQELGPIKLNGKWMWNYLPAVSDLCDLCEERVAAGKKPACVHHCMAQCLELVAFEDLPKILEEKGNTVAVLIP